MTILKDDREVELLEEILHRIERIEKYLGLPAWNQEALTSPVAHRPEDELEMQVGEYGLAWAGSIILFLGIVFLMTYTWGLGHHALASFLGYITSIVLYFASRFWRKSIPHLSRLMACGTSLLAFYTTLRLYYFTSEPLIQYETLVLGLLLLVVGFQFYQAILLDQEIFAALGILLGISAALLWNETPSTFWLIALACAGSIVLSRRRSWIHLPAITIALAYAAHLLWMLNSPYLGRPLQFVETHQFHFIYLFLYASIFAFTKTDSHDAVSIATLLLNCLGFSVLISVAVLMHFQESFAAMFLAVAIFFILASIVEWRVTQMALPAAIFASFGFLALSISIYGLTPVPTTYFWLSLQSLLVVSMALWMRSRTLVVVNTLIFAMVLIVYLLSAAASSNLVNFTFAFTALASARIMNWKKERLTLKTGLLRNIYLSIAFVMILFSLKKAVPPQYVTLSWAVAGLGYFLLSHLLRNIKYRWMGTLAIVITVFYVFLVDFRFLSSTYRVMAFLVLGLMVLGLSIFYSRIRRLLTRQQS